MRAAIRTAATLTGVLAVALLTVGFLDELRNVLHDTADSGLALVIPFLVLGAVLAALTSPATGLVLNIIASAMMFLALTEGEGTVPGYAGLAMMVVMSGLLILLLRQPDEA